jgi:peptide chain release factor subunit 1
MLSQHDLQQLASYQGSDVLSLYINVDPTRQTNDEYRLALRHLLKSVNGTALPEDVTQIETYFDHEYDWSGRSVALFSAQKSDFWRAYPLALPLANYIHIGHKPYIAPLMAVWDTYGSYGVALIDRLGVKLMVYQMGELMEVEGTMGEEVRSVKTGRGSSMVGHRGGSEGHTARRVAEVIRRNVKESAAMAASVFAASQCKQILIGGADEVANEFMAALPAPWPDRVAGTFAAAIDTPEDQLREITLSILAENARRREHELADKVITAAAKGANGVARLDDTLSAARDGRIQMLLVAEGYEAPGYRCNQCGYVTTQELQPCPFCGGTFTHISHAVEAMIEQIVAQGSEIRIINDHAQLKEAGVAALLRY